MLLEIGGFMRNNGGETFPKKSFCLIRLALRLNRAWAFSYGWHYNIKKSVTAALEMSFNGTVAPVFNYKNAPSWRRFAAFSFFKNHLSYCCFYSTVSKWPCFKIAKPAWGVRYPLKWMKVKAMTRMKSKKTMIPEIDRRRI